MLLLDTRTGDPTDVRVRLRDRISSRLHADQLDVQLAHGASPDATVGLALRARFLTSDRTRRTLAGGLRRVVAEASTPPMPSVKGRGVAQRFDRGSVLSAVPEIEELRSELLAPGPVSPQGVAQARTLLSIADIRARDIAPLVHEARGALELCLA